MNRPAAQIDARSPAAKQKQIGLVDCDGLLHSGMRLALEARLEEMCALIDTAFDWSDPEGVHKMRVASRRLRGALRDFAPWLGKRRIASSQKQIREIAQVLGRVRDYDVAIMTLERTAAKAPPEVSQGILRLAQFQEAGRQEARVSLTAVLTHESLSELTVKFKEALDVPATGNETNRSLKQKGAMAREISYREVARSIVLDRLEEFEKLSKSLYQPLKIEPLHEMRIGAKHLRYALELFEHCWGTPVVFMARKVAGLQSSLGKLHDCDVWIEDFGQLASRGIAGQDFDHRATLVWLLCHFVKLRGKHLTAALGQWQEWEAKRFSSGLRETLEAPAPV